MNKIYKIVWSKAKHAYVVTSEVARSHTKSASGKAVKAALAAAVGMGVLMGGYTANAADTTTGSGSGVAYGTGSNAPKAENVAIGKDATISYSGGVGMPSTGDIVIGNKAKTNNYFDQGGGIAIGSNSFVENMVGGLERSFDFNQAGYNTLPFIGKYGLPKHPDKMVTGVAIGQNTYARSGSVMLGTHNYKGALGDVTVDSAGVRSHNLLPFATALGANSYSHGLFSSVTGAYSIISSDYGSNSSAASKNFGATITGSLNSIESATSSSNYSGVANSIVGTANRTANSNGSLIFGAGNEITNSIDSLSGTPTDGGASAKDLADTLRSAVRNSESGGATLAIGGGNKADYTQKTSIIGVNNTVTGTSRRPSTYNSITGFKNAAANVNHVSVIGSENEIENTDDALVLGNKRKLAGANGSVILGSGDSVVTTSVANAVSIGHNANVTVAGGVALGNGSVASVDKGVAGYDPSTKASSTDTSSTWKATEAAVSVGDTSKNITRQITGVAAGTEDTDAVNVAQLKKVEAKAEAAEKKHTTVKAGDYATITEGTNADGGKEYTVSGPKMESTDGTVKITDKVENGKKVGYNLSVDTSSLGIEKTKVEEGDNVTVTSKKTGNTTTYTVSAKDTVVTGGTATYALNGTGTATLTNNDGTTATITGLQDRYTTSAALDGNTLNFTRNDGSTYSVSGIASTQDIKNVTNKVGELGTRVNRVGAGAAALAALHPLDFDPDDKWDVAAGYGNYKDAHAVAVGAFYRPNEDTMFSVGGSFGGGENMVNAGVSVKLGQGNHVSTSRVALAKEVEDLKAIVKAQSAEIKAMRGAMQSGASVMKDVNFPDVPKDHWAYSYVKSLADRGLLEGYPDGEFKGDRSMTRYEFAAIIYRALQNGAPIDGDMAKAIGEFEPEINRIKDLDRTRVDRISGKDNDRHKVERVRVNNESNKETGDYRDVYGSHISPEA
ncbi:ESPR-type extended signal peptide-containing protein [Dialister invisus]|uniref:ESPR-type extended signal peptide-containing protein n=2 Tax=Dialister TaxID=39948 RepID=UPI002880AB12|nr:ESPR-type extended signal peptide-containing protein [Dialister invisus]